jgi:Gamma-glutamyl cyclotransferase, AIG2-like
VEGHRLRRELSAFVFGYGSLVADAPGAAPARLAGRSLRWGVAMDNAVDLPGYKCYLAPDGSRPDVCVAFLDVAEDPGGAVDGLCVPVPDGALGALDARERNYDRVEVAVRGAAGTVWAYAGRPDSRARFAQAVRDGRCMIARAYLEAVRDGLAAALGPGAVARLDDATARSGLPVRDLRRVDLP